MLTIKNILNRYVTKNITNIIMYYMSIIDVSIIETILVKYINKQLVIKITNYAWLKNITPCNNKCNQLIDKCYYGNFEEALSFVLYLHKHNYISAIDGALHYLLHFDSLGYSMKFDNNEFFPQILNILLAYGGRLRECCGICAPDIERYKYVLANIDNADSHQEKTKILEESIMAQYWVKYKKQNPYIFKLVIQCSREKYIKVDWNTIMLYSNVYVWSNIDFTSEANCFDTIFNLIKHELDLVDNKEDIVVNNKDDPIFNLTSGKDILYYLEEKTNEDFSFNVSNIFKNILLSIITINKVGLYKYVVNKVGKQNIKKYIEHPRIRGRPAYEWILRHV